MDAAIAALRAGVWVDSPAPLRRYALNEYLLQGSPGPAWTGLQRVYAQWIARYPQRAEWYVTEAMVDCEGRGDLAASEAVLARGMAAGAEPSDLLAAYRFELVALQPSETACMRR